MPPESTNLDMSKHVETLFEGVGGVTDEQRSQMTVILETATTAILTEERVKMQEEVNLIAEDYDYAITLADTKIDELMESFNAYTEYAINSWMANNEVAIESGLKIEMAESAIDGLKSILSEFNIHTVPDEVDIVEAHAVEIAALREHLNTAINENIELTDIISSESRTKIINEHHTGLTDTQKEKFNMLIEGVDHNDDDTFNDKCKVIRELF